MSSKVLVSGKHPVIVRLSEQEYKMIKHAAFIADLSPNMYMARASVQAAEKDMRKKE